MSGIRDFAGLGEILLPQQLDKIDERLRKLTPETERLQLPRDLLKKTRQFALRENDVLPYLTIGTSGNVRQQARDIEGILVALRDSPTGNLPLDEVRRLFSLLEDKARQFCELMAPLGSTSPAAPREILQSALELEPLVKSLEKQVVATQKRASRALASATEASTSAQDLAAQEVSTTLGAVYRKRAVAHKTSANWWLSAVIVSSVILIIAGWILVAVPERIGLTEYTEADEMQAVFFRELPWKVAIAASLGFIVYFCARNYRINRHMTISYEFRASVIAVALALRGAMDDPADKAAILQTAVTSSLSIPSTGCSRSGADQLDPGLAATVIALSQRSARRD